MRPRVCISEPGLEGSAIRIPHVANGFGVVPHVAIRIRIPHVANGRTGAAGSHFGSSNRADRSEHATMVEHGPHKPCGEGEWEYFLCLKEQERVSQSTRDKAKDEATKARKTEHQLQALLADATRKRKRADKDLMTCNADVTHNARLVAACTKRWCSVCSGSSCSNAPV